MTGIALGNSAIDKPGFPGATLLGQLQAFEEREKKLRPGFEVPDPKTRFIDPRRNKYIRTDGGS